MKISHKDLQELYKEFIREKIPLSRKNCPSPKDLSRVFRSETEESQKIKLTDHIVQCAPCLEEFEFLLEALRYEKQLKMKIEDLLGKKASPERKKVRISFISRVKKWTRLPRFSWKYASIIAGMALFIALGVFFLLKTPKKEEYRGAQYVPIQLLEPVDRSYSKTALLFKWSDFAKSEYYILEIFDETLLPLWKSEKIYTRSFVLPEKISRKLTENKTHFWMVTGYLPGGEKIESRLEDFFITE